MPGDVSMTSFKKGELVWSQVIKPFRYGNHRVESRMLGTIGSDVVLFVNLAAFFMRES